MNGSVIHRAGQVIALCAWLVPAARRADWRRQWLADLSAQADFLRAEGHAPDAIQRDLIRRSAGAFPHALWLRFHQWRTFMSLQDIRYAVRGLAHRPGFSAAIDRTACSGRSTLISWNVGEPR